MGSHTAKSAFPPNPTHPFQVSPSQGEVYWNWPPPPGIEFDWDSTMGAYTRGIPKTLLTFDGNDWCMDNEGSGHIDHGTWSS